MVRRHRWVLLTHAMCGIVLSGCAHSRIVEHPITSWFTAAEESTPVTLVTPADKHCQDLAKQRKRDVAYEGEDEATQREVSRNTYNDCIAWEARRNRTQSN